MNLKKLKRLVKQTEAVSPVVATLMLVLVAAGAAVGLNLFMNNFQEDATSDVALPDGTQALKIAGSSTVYEFSAAALAGAGDVGLTPFEEFAAQAGTPIKVELEKGGSGAGRQAVGFCLIDIGSSSSDPKSDGDWGSWPDCNGDGNKDIGQNMHVFHIAYDTLAVVVHEDNTACTAIEITEVELYSLYKVNGAGQAGVTDNLGNDIITGGAAKTGASGSRYTWDDLVTGGVCTAGAGGAATIVLGERQDPGGTEEGFCGKVMEDAYDAIVGDAAAYTIASADFTGADTEFGCDDDDQLDDDVFTLTEEGDGNQGIAANLDAADGLSFIGAGHVQTAGGMTAGKLADEDSSDYRSHTDVSSGAPAVRSLYYITAGEPSPVEQVWLDFVMDPHRNQLIAGQAGYVSVY